MRRNPLRGPVALLLSVLVGSAPLVTDVCAHESAARAGVALSTEGGHDHGSHGDSESTPRGATCEPGVAAGCVLTIAAPAADDPLDLPEAPAPADVPMRAAAEPNPLSSIFHPPIG